MDVFKTIIFYQLKFPVFLSLGVFTSFANLRISTKLKAKPEIIKIFEMRKTFLVFSTLSIFQMGCATMNGVGSKATLVPSLGRAGEGLKKALMNPQTLLPVVGTGIIAVGGWDNDISDWATENSPVFGSPQNASKWSDYLLDISKGMGYATFAYMKAAAKRDRPQNQGNDSFPSGHASGTAVYAGFSRFYVYNMNISNPLKYSGNIIISAIDYGCSWSRVEAGVHFPTDVLIGHAWGNFLAVFVSETFIGHNSLAINSAVLSRNEFRIGFHYQF
jgi:membrane-associated phospholipid phosphatase